MLTKYKIQRSKVEVSENVTTYAYVANTAQNIKNSCILKIMA